MWVWWSCAAAAFVVPVVAAVGVFAVVVAAVGVVVAATGVLAVVVVAAFTFLVPVVDVECEDGGSCGVLTSLPLLSSTLMPPSSRPRRHWCGWLRRVVEGILPIVAVSEREGRWDSRTHLGPIF